MRLVRHRAGSETLGCHLPALRVSVRSLACLQQNKHRANYKTTDNYPMTYIKQHLKYNTIMTGKVKKILEEIHPLDIIREVQKWPALYVKDSPERANTHFKLKIWHEIAKELFPEWDLYSQSDKDNKSKYFSQYIISIGRTIERRSRCTNSYLRLYRFKSTTSSTYCYLCVLCTS